jgi:radical SAM superfamily enzyme YgiQ (UPF0313 family)
MRILLVDPPGKNKGLNTGLAYLSAALEPHHKVKILDLNNIEIDLCGEANPEMSPGEVEKRVLTEINDFDPQLVGVSVKTFTAEVSKHIFALIHKHQPTVMTAAGGPHITLDGHSFIEQNQIDFGIQGEGEYTFLELCDAVERKEGIGNIEGILYQENGQTFHNPRTNTIRDLDRLPLPNYDSFTSVASNGGILPEYPILTSRGCPYKCSYCSMPKIMGGKWRSHTPARVIEELSHAKKRYKSKSFTVVDDNFTLSLKRVDIICDLLVSSKLNLPWSSQNGIRADRINPSLAEKMKLSGCTYVWIGVETADEDVFVELNKGEELQKIGEGIKHLRAAGIRVGGFFIVGLPGSTREADLKSIFFVKSFKIDGWWFNFVPYPHTEAWDWVQAHGHILRPIDGVVQYGSNDIEPVFETAEYSKQSRIDTYNEIHVKLKYFDRLADPSLKQLKKWPLVYKKVRPHGLLSVFSLLTFIAKYNVRQFLNRLR